MAQVIFENVYKSFPRRKTTQNLTSEGQKTNFSESPNNSVSILRNINLTVEDGEFVVLVGQSGCGKSTLLRLLAGLETPTGGNIYIGDRSVSSLPPKARDIAMVFQNYALYPHLNVYNNIAFGLRRSQKNSRSHKSSLFSDALVNMTRKLPASLHYYSPKEKAIAERVKSVAQLLQIEHLFSRLPKELSGGQKQRVALGRAIARSPQVFLMDEPLSNLDAKLRTETRGQIVELQKQLQTTTIYVTHDQTEAMTMGDRIAIMDRGQIQQIAKPLEVYNRPANLFVAGFIGSPPMNFLSVALREKQILEHPQFNLSLSPYWQAILARNASSSLVLGIRPQHFIFTSADNSDLYAIVDAIEALGNETYLYCRLADRETKLIIHSTSDRNFTVGEVVYLKLDLEKIHLFDADTGNSLRNLQLSKKNDNSHARLG